MKRLSALLLCLMLILGLTGCRKPAEDPYADMKNPIATITMENGGVMRFELHLECAPNTVANFTKLANDGYYDGLEFFRVVPGTLIQSGCTANNGSGNAGYTIQGEFERNGIPNPLSHVRGTLSMARISGDKSFDTASSQYFIMLSNCPEYDGYYAAFGTALDAETLTTLDAVGMRRVDADYVPMVRQKVATVRVETFGALLEPVTQPLPEAQ